MSDLPKPSILYRTKNILHKCGHIMGIIVNSPVSYYCPYCRMHGNTIQKCYVKHKTIKNLIRKEIFSEVFYKETGAFIDGINNIIYEYLQ